MAILAVGHIIKVCSTTQGKYVDGSRTFE